MRGTPLAAPLLAALAACAHVEAPPGGPEDRLPPQLAVTRPGPDEVVPGFRDPVVFAFDERLSEQGIQDAVLVSPRTSPVEVRHSGSEIRVSLRRGWEPDRIYQVALHPGLRDLFGNQLAEAEVLTFSTGPAIPDTRLEGRVVDRVTGREAVDVRVEAVRAADSLVYATRTDSAGGFALEKIPEGAYQVRAFEDQNRNRALDAFEARDTLPAEVAAGAPASVALRLLAPDTTGPRIASVAPGDSSLTVRFDDFLDPEQEVDPASVEVRAGDGPARPVARAAIGALPAPDSAAAAPPDSADADPDAAAGPLPSQELVVELAPGAALAPGTSYVVTVRAIRNLNGLAADAEREFQTPAAPPEPAAGQVPPAAPPG